MEVSDNQPVDKQREDSWNELSEKKVQEECHACRTTTETVQDERKEDKIRTVGVLNQSNQQQNFSGIDQCEPPIAHVHPSFPSFLKSSLRNPGIHVKLNLPKLVIPEQLPQIEEIAIRNLHALLRYNNFVVLHRPTLAFFVLGAELDVRAAAQCFVNFHNLSKTEEFKSPNRERMEAIEADGLIEGFVWHKDGTFGPLINLQKWNVQNHTAAYVLREALCYIFNMADLAHVRRGLTAVCDARNFTWRAFAPFEQANFITTLRSVMPIQNRRKLYLDPGWYFMVADSVLRPLLPDSVNKKSVVLSRYEAAHTHPLLVLPRSKTGMVSNKDILHLSTDIQVNFRFFLDCGMTR